jgi:hypothetical protein
VANFPLLLVSCHFRPWKNLCKRYRHPLPFELVWNKVSRRTWLPAWGTGLLLGAPIWIKLLSTVRADKVDSSCIHLFCRLINGVDTHWMGREKIACGKLLLGLFIKRNILVKWKLRKWNISI